MDPYEDEQDEQEGLMKEQADPVVGEVRGRGGRGSVLTSALYPVPPTLYPVLTSALYPQPCSLSPVASALYPHPCSLSPVPSALYH